MPFNRSTHLTVASVDIHNTLLSLLSHSPTSVTSLSCQATSCVGVCVCLHARVTVCCDDFQRLEIKLRRRVMDRAR